MLIMKPNFFWSDSGRVFAYAPNEKKKINVSTFDIRCSIYKNWFDGCSFFLWIHTTDVIYMKSNRCTHERTTASKMYAERMKKKIARISIELFNKLISWCCFPLSVFSINVITFLQNEAKFKFNGRDVVVFFCCSLLNIHMHHHYYLIFYKCVCCSQFYFRTCTICAFINTSHAFVRLIFQLY